MKRLILLLMFVSPAAAAPPAGRDVDIIAPDGIALKATYFAAARPGPAVLLMHMCITTRISWEPVAQQLSAAGISALTIDNRGFGESGGPRFDPGKPEVQRQLNEQWPGDFDAAFAWLVAQPGVNKSHIGAGGGSCGVNNAVKLASRHPEVRSLVLLAGGTDSAGVKYLDENPWVPILSAAAADDEFDSEAPQLMRWFAEVSGNSRNRFIGFKDGRHGTEIFGPHPELPRQIVAWFVDTLVKSPTDATARFTRRKTATSEFWAVATQRGAAAKAARLFRDARTRDPRAFLFPESILNQLAYRRLQDGDTDDAVELFKLNVEAYSTSANAQDSLADGYAAHGQNDLALAAEQKCLDLLPADRINDQFKAALRQAAEQKIATLKAKSFGQAPGRHPRASGKGPEESCDDPAGVSDGVVDQAPS
jgi:dienelactone hydrolase